MSVSRKGELYYTEEELEKALNNNNALQYAMSRGYHLVQQGNEFHLKEHDSMVFTRDGRWHWNSQDLHGRALDFMQAYENCNYVEAVCTLAGTLDARPPIGPVIHMQILPAEKKEFVLPERAGNCKIIFAYLLKERGIDPGLVKKLVKENKIYQSKKYNNLVMVGSDSNHIARYASVRSTNSFTKAFKIDVPGSDKSYPFIVDETVRSDTVRVFESPIEAMSYWSLCKETGSSFVNDYLLSKGGSATVVPLERFLKEHPAIKNIVFCLNNDSQELGHKINAGQKATRNLSERFKDEYHISTHIPYLNDWNDVLKNYRKNLEAKMHQLHRPEVQVGRGRSQSMVK